MGTDTVEPAKRLVFTSAEEAENYFYHAIHHNDIDNLMQVWADDDDIICIHREGQRLIGTKQVHDSWRALLTQGGKFTIELKEKRVINNGMTIIHVLLEKITQTTEHGTFESICHATNVFQKDSHGWHLIMYMAAIAPDPVFTAQEAQNFPGYFH